MTIKDIANIAGVSTATVSRVINESTHGVGETTRKRVLEVIKENNFHPSNIARGMVTKKSKIIAIIVSDCSNFYNAQLIKGAEKHANTNGYSLIVCNTFNNVEVELNYIKTLSEKKIDGIIYVESSCELRKFTENIKLNVPIVSTDKKLKDLNFSGIYTDFVHASFIGTKYLIDAGHKTIVFLGNGTEKMAVADFVIGYRRAHNESNIKCRDMNILTPTNKNEYLENLNNILEQNNATACFCSNSEFAIKTMVFLNEIGKKIPENFSLISFGSEELSSMTLPKITTVFQSATETGHNLSKMLLEKIYNNSVATYQQYVKPELVIHSTSMKI